MSSVSLYPTVAPVLNVPPDNFVLDVFEILSAAPIRKVPACINVFPVYELFPVNVHIPLAVIFLTEDEELPAPLITPLINPFAEFPPNES